MYINSLNFSNNLTELANIIISILYKVGGETSQSTSKWTDFVKVPKLLGKRARIYIQAVWLRVQNFKSDSIRQEF